MKPLLNKLFFSLPSPVIIWLRAIHYRLTPYKFGPNTMNVGDFWHDWHRTGQHMVVTKKKTRHVFWIQGYQRHLRPATWFDHRRAAILNFFRWHFKTKALLSNPTTNPHARGNHRRTYGTHVSNP